MSSPQPTPVEGPKEFVTVRFSCKFSSVYGQSIRLVGSHPDLGNFDPKASVPLKYEPPGVWTSTFQLPVYMRTNPLRYKYLLKEGDEDTWESGPDRYLATDVKPMTSSSISEVVGIYFLKDTFQTVPTLERDVFSTAAFTEVIFRREMKERKSEILAKADESSVLAKALILGETSFVLRFSLFVTRLLPQDEVCLTGSIPELGANDPTKALVLADTCAPIYSVTIAVPLTRSDFQFKYFIRKKGTKDKSGSHTGDLLLEAGEPRNFSLTEAERSRIEQNTDTVIIVDAPWEDEFQFPSLWRGSGVALPVFSIRSKTSMGVGEFTDLPKVVDFCSQTGCQLLQLLPINDTTVFNTWRDSYPYSAVSCFALHPQYVNVDSIGKIPTPLLDEIKRERDRLNALSVIDYEQVMAAKMTFFKRIYLSQKSEFLKSKPFLNFFRENQKWLVPYAVFRMFTELNGSANFDLWGKRGKITMKELEELATPEAFHFDYIGLHYFIQYHAHVQLSAASIYAAKNGVVFKGDLPIGINRYCVDTWVSPKLYRLNVQAGAPPDYFSEYGQNWFFPTYDWDEMAKDDYTWWRRRLTQMAKYFHAYRIDHILGFFRIWEIPQDHLSGMAGRFRPALPEKGQYFSAKGLWDMDRYLSPYVHDGLLQRIFGDKWKEVKDKFFVSSHGNRLRFKDTYSTEKKLVEALELPDDATQGQQQKNEFIKSQLILLMNNVVLLRDVEDPDMYHPRFMMQRTTTFQELPEDWKRHFNEFHEDYFFKRHNDLWKEKAMEKLPMMQNATNMLICGEDLGLIPDCVPEVMESTGIIGLRVQRMPPSSGVKFDNPAAYPYGAVATLSSHDTSTFRGWWEEISDNDRSEYWHDILKRDGEPPKDCKIDIVEQAINQHLASPALWSIFPIQDLLGMDEKLRRPVAAEEQINNPANSMHYWRFRLHLNIEDILESKLFLEKIKQMNIKNGRGIAY